MSKRRRSKKARRYGIDYLSQMDQVALELEKKFKKPEKISVSAALNLKVNSSSKSSNSENIFHFNFFKRFSKSRTGGKTPFELLKINGKVVGRRVLLKVSDTEEHELILLFPDIVDIPMAIFDSQTFARVNVFSKGGEVELEITNPEIFKDFLRIARKTGAWSQKRRVNVAKVSLAEILNLVKNGEEEI